MNAMFRHFPLLVCFLVATVLGCRSDSESSTADHPEHTAEDFQQYLDSDDLVLVKFGAPWCGPCREVDKELDKLEAANGDQLQVVRINVDNEPKLADQYSVSAIPMLLLFKAGQPVEEWRGFKEASEFQAAIDAAL